MSKDSFKNVIRLMTLYYIPAIFPLNISLSTPRQILDKNNNGVYNSFKQNDSHIENIENDITEKFNDVALNHLKNQII